MKTYTDIEGLADRLEKDAKGILDRLEMMKSMGVSPIETNAYRMAMDILAAAEVLHALEKLTKDCKMISFSLWLDGKVRIYQQNVEIAAEPTPEAALVAAAKALDNKQLKKI